MRKPSGTSAEFAVRDLRGGEYYRTHNVFIDIYAGPLGPYAAGIYHLLCRHANNDSQSCFPSTKYIAKTLQFSRTTVVESIKKLEEYGIIYIHRQTNDQTGNEPNTYYLLPLENWVHADQHPKPKSVTLPPRQEK